MQKIKKYTIDDRELDNILVMYKINTITLFEAKLLLRKVLFPVIEERDKDLRGGIGIRVNGKDIKGIKVKKN